MDCFLPSLSSGRLSLTYNKVEGGILHEGWLSLYSSCNGCSSLTNELCSPIPSIADSFTHSACTMCVLCPTSKVSAGVPVGAAENAVYTAQTQSLHDTQTYSLSCP